MTAVRELSSSGRKEKEVTLGGQATASAKEFDICKVIQADTTLVQETTARLHHIFTAEFIYSSQHSNPNKKSIPLKDESQKSL